MSILVQNDNTRSVFIEHQLQSGYYIISCIVKYFIIVFDAIYRVCVTYTALTYSRWENSVYFESNPKMNILKNYFFSVFFVNFFCLLRFKIYWIDGIFDRKVERDTRTLMDLNTRKSLHRYNKYKNKNTSTKDQYWFLASLKI